MNSSSRRMDVSYDIRIWGIDVYSGKKRKTYRVRWAVAGNRFAKSFETRKLSETFRSKLLTSAREGIPFDITHGLPPSLAPSADGPSWYDHACAMVDMKWPHSSARHRKSIAEALTTVTIALLPIGRGTPDRDALRHALYSWAFNSAARTTDPAQPVARVIDWVEANGPRLSDLSDPVIVRRALDGLTLRLDGASAASTTIARKRAVLYGTLRYAVELRHLPANPVDTVHWRTPKNAEVVDRRVVVNPDQARQLLTAAGEIEPALEAFYACLYFAALRPAEALHLVEQHCQLPETGWGELTLTGSTQQTGTAWGDNGTAKEDRELKHRATNDTRRVPACPELVAILRRHLDQFDSGVGGRLFVTRTGLFGRPVAGPYANPVSTNTYSRVWRQAREVALTGEGTDSLLARRPYDLRHAAVSLWLNAGVPATQVAEWAGHSVNVLMRVYAKCIYGQDEAARRRIEAALSEASRIAT